ncbi:MAG TPA: D-alanyl-D-alanine carboxypeptidase/D-alanyl-D-alanine-endopeptidase [Longimicrobium sp.]|jgi:D-alanyl-D-alanine carboxypeptidase/D-alanyl-D-alanine-endopeptidase (penicillin-binding protein 4)
MNRIVLAAALTLGACAPAAPALVPAPARAPVAMALDSIFGDTLFARAQWGVLVRSLETGETLYQRNAEKLFVPASNQKIVTGAFALETLGPDFRYRTSVEAEGPVSGGVLAGSLVVRGSGDPTISARFGGVRPLFRAWADSLRARGVTRIAGAVVGNDDVFDDVPLGRGWAWDDLDASYSAEVSGLQLNEGYVTVRVGPGARPGDPAVVTLDPATAYTPVINQATTGAPGTARAAEATRAPLGPGIVVTGTVPPDSAAEEIEVAVRDNTLFFAAALRESLIEAGIRVDGPALDDDARPDSARRPATRLFVHTSPPMPEVLAAFLKPSQNQIGEILLKTMGRQLRGAGTASAGLAVEDSLARAWALPPRALRPADGSGLSRYNLVAPEFLTALLERMTRSPHNAVFYDAMPVAGVDGTLRNRMKGTPLEGNVHAKTGTLSGVRSLSGYLTTAAGERLVFAILVNNHTLSAAAADRVSEAALLRVYHHPRTRAGRD